MPRDLIHISPWKDSCRSEDRHDSWSFNIRHITCPDCLAVHGGAAVPREVSGLKKAPALADQPDTLNRLVAKGTQTVSNMPRAAIDRSERNGYVLLLFMELLNYAKAVVRLSEGEQSNTIYFVVRGMLECLADLANLVDDESYLDVLLYQYVFEKRRVLKRAKVGNPYLEQFQSAHIDSRIAEQDEKLVEIKSRRSDAADWSIRRKCEIAGLATEHGGLYPFLSMYVHRGLPTLSTRHLEGTKFPPPTSRQWSDNNELDSIFALSSQMLEWGAKELEKGLPS